MTQSLVWVPAVERLQLLAESVVSHPRVVIGSGLRHSKLRLPGPVLATLAGAKVQPGLAG